MFNWGFTLRTTLTPQPCVVGFSLPSCVLVPFADAIATVCNNRYYIHFVLYKSPGCTTLTPQTCVVGFLFFLCRIAPYSRQQQTVACFQNLAMVYLSCKDIKGALNGNEKDYSGTSLEKGDVARRACGKSFCNTTGGVALGNGRNNSEHRNAETALSCLMFRSTRFWARTERTYVNAAACRLTTSL